MRAEGRTIGELTEARVEQCGPGGRIEFTYVDISSIDRETKRIIDPKKLPTTKAPSRAKQVLKAGDVLVSMTRPNLNAVAVVPPSLEGAIGSTGFHVLRGKEVASGFLFYAVQTPRFVDAMCQKVQGALYPAVRPRDISSFCLPPFSLAEQRRIVAEIEKQFTRLEAGVAALRRVQANLKRYRAAILKAACEGRLVPTETELHRKQKSKTTKFETGAELLTRIIATRREKWNGRGKYEEPVAPNTSKLESLPEGWTWANIGQLRVFSLYGPRFSSDDYADDGYVVLRTTDISESGKVDTTKAPRLRLSKEDFEKYRAQRGDLLVTRTGSLGTLAIFDDEVEAIPGAYLIQFRLATEPITTRYLFYFLKSPIGHSYLSGKGAGVGRPNINAPTIEALSVPLPPLAEQARIVAEVERRLSVVEELESVVNDNLQRATRLRQSILQKAFTGQL